MILRSALLTLALACALPGATLAADAAPAADGSGPRATVQATTSQVIGVLANASLPTDEKRHRVEQIVYAQVDFETLSRLVLARNWSQLSEAQQKQFMEEFRQNLSATYGRNVESYKNEKVRIIDDHTEPRGDWTVRTKIVRNGSDDINVDYRLRQIDGSWKIIDIIIENVSLVANFRSQFQEIMSNGGPGRLLQVLHEKNERGEPLKAPAAATS
ncbi:MAG TPA: ABC transporter substrate-binding protein [Candidatus Binatia bacterium]